MKFHWLENQRETLTVLVILHFRIIKFSVIILQGYRIPSRLCSDLQKCMLFCVVNHLLYFVVFPFSRFPQKFHSSFMLFQHCSLIFHENPHCTHWKEQAGKKRNIIPTWCTARITTWSTGSILWAQKYKQQHDTISLPSGSQVLSFISFPFTIRDVSLSCTWER